MVHPAGPRARHRLFDIRIAAAHVAALVVTLCAAAALQVILFRLLRVAMGADLALTTSLAVLVAIAYLTPLNRYIRNMARLLVLQGKYDYQATLRRAPVGMVRHLERAPLVAFILELLRDSLRVEKAAVLLVQGGHLVVEGSIGPAAEVSRRVEEGTALIDWLRLHRQPLVLDEVARCGPSEEFAALSRAGSVRNGDMLVPFFVGEVLRGAFCLGPKGNGDHYLTSDLHLLEKVASQAAIALENSRLFQEAVTDGLTGLYHNRHLRTRLVEEVTRARTAGRPLALAMLDLDHFKRLNDTHGHLAGDEVLLRLATILREETDGDDVVARFGGEEFVIAMPRTTLPGALRLAERVRHRVAVDPLLWPRGVTLSAGVASLGPEEGSVELLERADRALYRAKAAGRNRVEADLALRLAS